MGDQCVVDAGVPGGTGTPTTSPTPSSDPSSPREPRVWRVCASGAPFDEIQDAVDEARNGDVIEICAGTYEHARIVSVDVEIRGEDKHSTVIDGGAFYAALYVEDADVVVSGVTLTGSPAPPYQRTGGLQAVLGASVVLTEAIVSGMRSGDVPSASAVLATDSALTLDRVWLTDNETGGNLVYVTRGSFTALHSVLSGNVAQNLLVVTSDVVDFRNNLVFENDASILGASFSAYSGPVATDGARNNTFARNDFPWIGAALGSPNAVPFHSNIVADNDSTWGIDAPGRVVDYTNSWGSATNWADPDSAGAGSLEVDPEFQSSLTGDFRLEPGSPCVDAGSPDPALADPDGSRNDMGAFGGPDGDWDPLEVL